MHKLWVHDESLGLATRSNAFFIMDWVFFNARAWSAKRVYFVLSVLRNSGVEIIQGNAGVEDPAKSCVYKFGH